MKLDFLALPEDERRTYIEEAARRLDVASVVVEKDFWVCWLLSVLFESEFGEHIVFKGGTSLSKVFRVIGRFSEDIDLSLAPAFLNLPEVGMSRTQANKWMTQAEIACGAAVQTQLMPAMEAAVARVLGKANGDWFEFQIDTATRSPILFFHYPSRLPAAFAYLNRAVKLEFGSLTDQRPSHRHPITPWIVEVLPASFPDWKCEVVALAMERTFWEKATILHAEYHRPMDKPTPDRFSRHYADTAALAKAVTASKVIDESELCIQVVKWKRQFFGSTWANYDDAKPGTFRLVPPAARLPKLREDYKAMRDMYLSEPPNFGEILATLDDLEKRINSTAR